MLSMSIGYNMIQPSLILPIHHTPPNSQSHPVGILHNLEELFPSRCWRRRSRGIAGVAQTGPEHGGLVASIASENIVGSSEARPLEQCAGKMSSRLSSCQNLQRVLSLMASSLIFYRSLNGFNVDSHRFMGSFLLIAQWISMA